MGSVILAVLFPGLLSMRIAPHGSINRWRDDTYRAHDAETVALAGVVLVVTPLPTIFPIFDSMRHAPLLTGDMSLVTAVAETLVIAALGPPAPAESCLEQVLAADAIAVQLVCGTLRTLHFGFEGLDENRTHDAIFLPGTSSPLCAPRISTQLGLMISPPRRAGVLCTKTSTRMSSWTMSTFLSFKVSGIRAIRSFKSPTVIESIHLVFFVRTQA